MLCHGAFDLVHMGHLIHFEEARSLGDILVVTITADRHITKKRSVSFSEEYRARQLAALEIVDYVAIVDEPSAVTPIEALQPDVYVKGPEYANLVLDKTANIFREKALVERYGGRIHFTTGETFSSTKLSHFLLASPEAVAEQPAAAQRSGPVPRSVGARLHARAAEGLSRRRERGCASACIGETIIDEWVDVTRHQPVAEVALRGGPRDGAQPADRRRRRRSRCTSPSFVSEVHCFTNGLTGPLPANVTVDAPRRRIRSSRRGSSIATPATGCSSPRARTCSDVRRERLPDFDDYDLVLIADFGHGLLDAEGDQRADRRRASERSSPRWRR